MHLKPDFLQFVWLVSLSLLSLLTGCLCQNQYVNYELDPAAGPTYQPRPPFPQPRSSDPNIIFVPRLGEVRGIHRYREIRHRAINAYLGLKYATVGTGLARFQKATPFVNYGTGIIEAQSEAPNCPQFPELSKVQENEELGINTVDCLTLNVFTPNRTGLLPVMVFVHGDMLFDGEAAEAQPDYLLEHDVVLVSINYRLAPFGFLTTLTDQIPGNVALADIQSALIWVNENIQAFGGHPDQVTLFGQAGGATLVHALSLSGKAEGLFHKLILQSGTALNPYFIDEDAVSTARSFMRLTRCYGSTLQHINSCLERMSTSELLTVFQRHWEDNEQRGLSFTGGFKLSVGDKLDYLPVHPAALLGNMKYPVIAGVTKDAGAFLFSRFYDQLKQVRSRNLTDYLNVVLKHISQPRHYAIWQHLAKTHIFTEENKRNPSPMDLSSGLLELINLALYRAPIIESVRQTYLKFPTYLYSFDYRGQFHRYAHFKSHFPYAVDSDFTDDSLYLFPYPEENRVLNPEDMVIARAFSTMWFNFALYSLPNTNEGVWPHANKEYGPFVRITNSKVKVLEIDVHFCEGISIPVLYPEHSRGPIITTTTRRPYNRTPYQYRPYETVLNENNNNNNNNNNYNYNSPYRNF